MVDRILADYGMQNAYFMWLLAVLAMYNECKCHQEVTYLSLHSEENDLRIST